VELLHQPNSFKQSAAYQHRSAIDVVHRWRITIKLISEQWGYIPMRLPAR
jgi:hypothetical protein